MNSKLRVFQSICIVVVLIGFLGNCQENNDNESRFISGPKYDQDTVLMVKMEFQADEISIQNISIRDGVPVFSAPPGNPDLIMEQYTGDDRILYRIEVSIPRWRLSVPPQSNDDPDSATWLEEGDFSVALPVFDDIDHLVIYPLHTDSYFPQGQELIF